MSTCHSVYNSKKHFFLFFFLKNLLSFSLDIVQVLLLLFVYKCPSHLETRSSKRYKYIHILNVLICDILHYAYILTLTESKHKPSLHKHDLISYY